MPVEQARIRGAVGRADRVEGGDRGGGRLARRRQPQGGRAEEGEQAGPAGQQGRAPGEGRGPDQGLTSTAAFGSSPNISGA